MGVLDSLERHGRIDVLYNNAGATRFDPIEDESYDDWQFTLRNELDVVFLATKYAWPHLKRRGGSVILVGSTAGRFGEAGHADYAAAKAAIQGGLLLSLKNEAARLGPRVRVNAVAPGFIVTEMTARMPLGTREVGSRINSLQQGGLPVDVAETIAWLSQPGSAGVNGQVVRVCGQSMLGA